MYKQNESLVSKMRKYSGPIMLTFALGLTPQLRAQEVKAPEQAEQKQEKSMTQEIGECVGSLKDYWISFQEQEATQCLVNYTNPDTWNPVGANVQLVECGVRAVVDHARHITPSESQREVLENLTAVYDNFLKIRELIEHPDPNAELIYKAIDDHIAELDRRSQKLAKVADKECGDMWISAYNVGKGIFDVVNNDSNLANKEELIDKLFSERLQNYINETPVHAQNGYAVASILEDVKKEVESQIKNNLEGVVQDSRASEERFRKSSVHDGVTSDQYVRTNELYNKNRVERGLKPVENLSRTNLDEVEVYNNMLRQIKEVDSQPKKDEPSQKENETPNPKPESIDTPSLSRPDPVDRAGRTPKENKSIDDDFHDKHPELGGRRLDPKDPKDKPLIKEWVKTAKDHDKKKGR